MTKHLTTPQAEALRTAAPYEWKRFDALDGRRIVAHSVRTTTINVLIRLGLVEVVIVNDTYGNESSRAYCLTRAGELTAAPLERGDKVRLDSIAYTVAHVVEVKPGQPEWEGHSVVAVDGGFHTVPAGGGIPFELHPLETAAKAVDSVRRQVNGERWTDLTWEQLGAEHNDRIADELGLPTSADAAYAEMDAARAVWETESPKFADAHVSSADQNADDTAREEGFEYQSTRWYEVAVSTLHSVRDDAEHCMNPKDPQTGQALMIKGGTDYVWVDGVLYGNADHSASEIRVVDRDGNRSTITPADVANTYGEEEDAPEHGLEIVTTDEMLALLADADKAATEPVTVTYEAYATPKVWRSDIGQHKATGDVVVTCSEHGEVIRFMATSYLDAEHPSTHRNANLWKGNHLRDAHGQA
jgi:hypothetical protein